MRSLPFLLLLTGCGLFGGARRGQEGPPVSPTARSSLDVTLVSKCTRAVDVCYGKDDCVTVAPGRTRSIHSSTNGTGEVFVRFRGASSGEFADPTFTTVEIEESCTGLRRRLPSSESMNSTGSW